MISFIKGKIIGKNKNIVILLLDSGIGYDVNLTPTHAMSLKVGDNLEVNTYLKVSENAMELYGFKSSEEKVFFILLLSVSGIGPKGAMNVLALGSIEQIQSAIARGDVAYLTQVQGMGKKTAERVVVELKTKMKKVSNISIGDNVNVTVLSEVIDGLIAMGYSKDEAQIVTMKLETEGKSTEELLKIVLQNKNT